MAFQFLLLKRRNKENFPMAIGKKRILIFGKLFWNRIEWLGADLHRERWVCYLSPELLLLQDFLLLSLLLKHCLEHLFQLIPHGAVSCTKQITLSQGKFVTWAGQTVSLGSCERHKTLDTFLPARLFIKSIRKNSSCCSSRLPSLLSSPPNLLGPLESVTPLMNSTGVYY